MVPLAGTKKTGSWRKIINYGLNRYVHPCPCFKLFYWVFSESTYEERGWSKPPRNFVKLNVDVGFDADLLKEQLVL